MSKDVFHISHYVNDGFQKVCDVTINCLDGGWAYTNINHDYMYNDHRSWVYFIVLDGIIQKAGETGNPLGIAESWIYGNQEVQPISGTKSRLGRYRKGDGTDSYIREALRKDIVAGRKVTVWAKLCPIERIKATVGKETVIINHTYHKDLEQAYFQHFLDNSNRLPRLNKAKK